MDRVERGKPIGSIPFITGRGAPTKREDRRPPDPRPDENEETSAPEEEDLPSPDGELDADAESASQKGSNIDIQV